METKINSELEKVFKSFDDKYYVDGVLNKAKVIEDLTNYDKNLLKALLDNEYIKNTFSLKIDNSIILKVNDLRLLLEMNNYWESSYTKYLNKIGLTNNGRFINEVSDIVLDFPFKDTILKASMSKENNDKNDLKPNESFLNEIIAKEDIDVLLDKKILHKAIKYKSDGSHENVSEYNNENLLIKGNNLIALHTLYSKYKDHFDVIYIDPPYNVTSSNNTFVYNNNFNHSSWLVFMKNRLEIAKKLLKNDDGVLIIAIDENEVNYLGVLIDEIYSDYEKHLITVIHNPRGVQGTNFSYNHEYLYFIFPSGKKIIEDRMLDKDEIKLSNLRNWGGESERKDGKNTFFSINVDIKTNEIIGFGNVLSDNEHPNQTEIKDNIAYVYPIDANGVERKWRYARQTIEEIKDMLIPELKKNGRYEILIGKNFGQYKTVWQSPRYDASVHGKQLLKKLVPEAEFSFPKSVYSVYDALYAVVKNRKDAKVLDFFSGSGTTAHAVQMLNAKDDGTRKYIMIEQMPYIESIQIDRLRAKDKDKKIDDFIYLELFEKNIGYIKEINEIKKPNEIRNLLDRIIRNADIDFRVDLELLKETFNSLTFEEQKQSLIKVIEKNQLYYNYSEIDDKNVRDLISDSDYKFNKSFYEEDNNE